MVKKWKYSSKNIKVADLARMIRDGEMVLDGAHQREFVWDSSMENSFINSLWTGMPVPKIYVLERTKDTEDEFCEETYYESIDGRQRSTTISKFMNNEITLLKQNTVLPDLFDDYLEGKTWKSFSSEERSEFGHTEVTVVVYNATTMSQEEIDELKDYLFQSLNISALMNTQERLRSKYRNTKLVQEIIRPLTTIDGQFFDLFEEVLSIDKITRQDDGTVISVIAYYLIKGSHPNHYTSVSGNTNTIGFYEYCKNNEETIDWDGVYKKIVDAIETLIQATEKCGGIGGTKFKSKASFMSMACAIIDLKSQGYKFNIGKLGDAISDFTSKLPPIKVVQDKGSIDIFHSYVWYSQSSQLGSSPRRNERHKILVEFLVEHAPDALIPPKNKDSQRRFSDEIKTKVYHTQKGYCAICGKWFSFEEMQADHIIPYSQGGPTTSVNCQCTCGGCNRKKGAKTNYTRELIEV